MVEAVEVVEQHLCLHLRDSETLRSDEKQLLLLPDAKFTHSFDNSGDFCLFGFAFLP